MNTLAGMSEFCNYTVLYISLNCSWLICVGVFLFNMQPDDITPKVAEFLAPGTYIDSILYILKYNHVHVYCVQCVVHIIP